MTDDRRAAEALAALAEARNLAEQVLARLRGTPARMLLAGLVVAGCGAAEPRPTGTEQ